MLKLLRKIGLFRGYFLRERRAAPTKMLELYSMEGCAACRRVRHVLTELDLDFVHRSCPRGASANRQALERLGGRRQVPFLVDPNTGTHLYESRDIVLYLETTYGGA
jgi:anaphase-promoting complex subunit 7